MQRTTTYQLDLTGRPAVAGNIIDRITYLLRTYPDTRNNYKTLIARYWIEFDGLSDVLPASGNNLDVAFCDWMRCTATSPKTIQNRAMEIQSNHPDLDADPDTRRRRDRQARQGVVR